MSADVVVAGMVAGDPDQGGASWAVLQYVLGLRRLGHRVLLVDPAEPTHDRIACLREMTDRFRLDGDAVLGPLSAANRARVARADVLLNVSGMLALDGDMPAVRVWLDLDPGFNQLWHESGIDMRFDGHTHYVTVGLGMGTATSTVPTCGRAWTKTLPPVVLAEWPVCTAPPRRGLTTVANWRSYGSIDHDGRFYGQKVHSFRTLMDLPSRTHTSLEPALNIDAGETDDLVALRDAGWRWGPASQVATTEAYRQFVQGSFAELAVAKAGYVTSGSGWFSERSACYLASGRPVLAQDTGFSRHLPTGSGLLAFDSAAGAARAIERVEADYSAHCAAARGLAEEWFDSDHVLAALLDRVGAA